MSQTTVPAAGTAPLPQMPAAAPLPPAAMQYGALHLPPVPIEGHDWADEPMVLVSVPKYFRINVTLPGRGSRVFEMHPGVQRVPARIVDGPEGWYAKANGCRPLTDNDNVQEAAYGLRVAALAASRGGSHPMRQVLPPDPGAPSRPPGADVAPYPAFQIPVRPGGVTDADWAAHQRVMEAAGIGGPDSRTLTADPDWEEKMLATERAMHGESSLTETEVEAAREQSDDATLTTRERAAAAARRAAEADAAAKAPPAAPAQPAPAKPANGGKLNPSLLGTEEAKKP